ncbi:hypothetical protein PAAG_11203 [Paracoccidioides lutzii Pb01]|uniref:Uncharacterized protein n=1 Tax=Paracoccidioides lutzii (strain ATCC MYA-826 / Pb01) TaxID=502779 RepID=A0A0A2V6Q4_PARBA|nr:hypothetical protein PAAG_11203 [Paracoccidioides lutzii Pb01]KGQ02027.1 hypothetical protein PAAG_11203 [Paracoccidioides lutzii Pb01]
MLWYTRFQYSNKNPWQLSFYDTQRSPRSSPLTMDQLLSQFVRLSLPHSADSEPGSSPDNLIDLDDRLDEKHNTEPLSED